MSEIQRPKKRLSLAIEEAFDLLESFSLDWENPMIQMCVGCYATCVELAQTIDFLSAEEKFFDAKILLRAMLEHYVELDNLSSNPTYLHKVHYKHAIDTLKILKASETDNPYFEKFSQRIRVEDETAIWEERKSMIASLGGKKQTRFDDFSAAGMEDEYKSVYANLSKLTHPTFGGIIERHLEYDEKDHKVKFFVLKEATPETKELVYSTTSDILEKATKVIANKLKPAI
ncbi:DUF5677 domain-containing protein [Loktanella sp. TSTF-M6]|uniref:DUF5677 domain-containing protein n=1 Tax=Loktanella gaetbuli TaxID=2881335 RepID=A0ABS8BSH4_9RHOB|nr:DUF5677 domain-containing protein [Loktanella gaetbuli]MCB5198690.1 DUF5677 domain-containing protein [Loktanella gaetbuli]